MQVRVELTITPMGMQNDDVAAFEGLTAEVAKELIALASLQGRSYSERYIA